MTTLDLPQHVYVCQVCHRTASTGICPDHPEAGVSIEPTLTYADFVRYMTACSLVRHPMPSDEDVWEWLETHTDTTAETNREAINNAIRAVGEETA